MSAPTFDQHPSLVADKDQAVVPRQFAPDVQAMALHFAENEIGVSGSLLWNLGTLVGYSPGAVTYNQAYTWRLWPDGEQSVLEYGAMKLRDLPDKIFTKDYLKKLD